MGADIHFTIEHRDPNDGLGWAGVFWSDAPHSPPSYNTGYAYDQNANITPDGRREVTEPVMVRVHKKDQQNAMNRHIKAVRRMLTLRAKLGGFNSVDWPKVAQGMTKRYGHGRGVLRNFETVNKMFTEIDDEDYLSMLPVLWLAAWRNSPYYWHEPTWRALDSSYDWSSAFNRLVNYVREGLRNEHGAVEYRPENEVGEKTTVA